MASVVTVIAVDAANAEGIITITSDLATYANDHGTTDGWYWPKTTPINPMPAPGDIGIDVSFYQGTIDWSQVKGAGIKFAFIKASEGNFTDTKFVTNWVSSKSVGIPRGAYHYFRIGIDPIVQAKLLTASTIDAELPLVVDVETQVTTTSQADFCSKLLVCLNEIESISGKKPMIYTGKYLWPELTGTPAWSNTYPLWIAQYPYGNVAPTPDQIRTMTPSLPANWTVYSYWQYTSSGKVAGIAGSVDLDICH